jgi:ring-1,2-phenylacetyl-CoA epoxidase subunit PaaC
VNEEAREVLAHADDNLILSQRLSEWVSVAPDLELDIAFANIALDHLGVARSLLSLFGEMEGKGRSEDDLAMFRTEREFTNLLIFELPNGDFGQTVARQLLIDAYQVGLWEKLSRGDEGGLADVAGKALLEARYHLQHSTTWIERLGRGSDESRRRGQSGLDSLARFVDEMFDDHPELRGAFDDRIAEALERAGLELPVDSVPRRGGRSGNHTEHLGHLLTEMQWLARAYPSARW